MQKRSSVLERWNGREGGGGRIFADMVRTQLCPKITGEGGTAYQRRTSEDGRASWKRWIGSSA